MEFSTFFYIFAKTLFSTINMESEEQRTVVSTKEAFNLIYDYLKKKRILREYVEACYEFHKHDNPHFRMIRPFGRENTKYIIHYNIKQYRQISYYGGSLSNIFTSFTGSFDWASSRLGSAFWKKYLDDSWRKYLIKKIGYNLYIG